MVPYFLPAREDSYSMTQEKAFELIVRLVFTLTGVLIVWRSL